jgi:hypothetical protein
VISNVLKKVKNLSGANAEEVKKMAQGIGHKEDKSAFSLGRGAGIRIQNFLGIKDRTRQIRIFARKGKLIFCCLSVQKPVEYILR